MLVGDEGVGAEVGMRGAFWYTRRMQVICMCDVFFLRLLDVGFAEYDLRERDTCEIRG